MKNFQKLSPSEMSSIYGGGIWDDIVQTWNDIKEYVRECVEDFTEGIYDATGCSGKH